MGSRTLFSLAASAVLFAALSGTALAHPAYKASDPPSGASVSAPPGELWVEFTETIEGGKLEVFDQCGAQVDNGDSTQNLTNDRITVTLSASMQGTYRVDWSVLGSDGHPTRGSFTFSASAGEECPDEEPPPSQGEPRGGTGPGEREGRPGSEQQPIRSGGGGAGPREVGREAASSGQGNGPRGPREAGDGRTEARTGRAGNAVAAPGDPEENPPAPDPGIWDGIPIGDFLVALGVAALIGAAGGRIYAGIMGPAPRR